MNSTTNSYSKKNNLKSIQQNQPTYASKKNIHPKISPTVSSSITSSNFRHIHCKDHNNNDSRINSTLKVSLQKSQQIGQNQYNKAMKHMKLINSLQKQSKQKQRDHLQIITQQHTFQPKINPTSQLNYLYQAHSLSAQKIQYLKNTGANQRQRNSIKIEDRLIKWGKTHLDKKRNQFIREQVSKDSLQKPQKIMKKSLIFTDMDQTISSISKHDQNYTLTSSRTYAYELSKKQPRPFINGEQKFYQKQAKAVALKNNQTFFYSTLKQNLNMTR